MTLIDDTVKKLFGPSTSEDPNSRDFMEEAFKDTDNICAAYFEQTPDSSIKDFLFEQTDLAKMLKRYIEEKKNGSIKEENT